ncbi:hypothetical protein ONZ45_g19712 [Pleurotus djamor]|nr:hypothetical protein ONZ45_g19712 [Pleurotus djamor]
MPPKQPGKRKKPPKATLNVFVDSGHGLAPQTFEFEVSPDLDFKQLPGKFRSALTEKGWRIQPTWTFAYFLHEITREEVIARLLDPPDGFKVSRFDGQSWSQLMKDLPNLDANVLHVYAYDGTAERKINVFNIHTRVIAEISSFYESTVRTGYRIVPPELRYIVGTPECDDYIQRLSKEDVEGYKIVGLFRALATIFPLHPPGVLHFIDPIPPPPPKASVTKGGMEPHPDPPANKVIDERTLLRSRQLFFTSNPSKSPWSDGGKTNLHYDVFHAVPTEQDMVNLFALRKAMIKVYETNAKGDADRGQAFVNAMGPVLGEILSERNIRGTQYTMDGCITWTIDQQSYSAHFAVYKGEPCIML